MVPKTHPLLLEINNDFVCISDITETYVPQNYVLYNPSLPFALRKEHLQENSFKVFNFTFTPEQLDYICQFGPTRCIEFIQEFKKLKKEIKHEDW